MATADVNEKASKSRIYLLIIIALFAVPLLLAWLLVGRWQPGGFVHHGELLNPAQPIQQLQAQTLEGSELDQSTLQHYWTLVFINNEKNCDDNCRQSLYNMRQIRLALGKNIDRAQTLLLLSEAPDDDLQTWLSREHAAMLKAVGNEPTRTFFQNAFPTDDNNKDSWIYLTDPLGNLVMRYGLSVDSKGILEDLRRLMKYSKIG